MPVVSSNTTAYDLVYISSIDGGIGLLGLSNTPDLTSNIYGTPLGEENNFNISAYINPTISSSLDLNATVSGEPPHQDIVGYITRSITYATSTDPLVYISLLEGGIGLYGRLQTPDLLANIIVKQKTSTSGSEDIGAIIRAIQKGEENLHGLIRSAVSGNSNLTASISGSFINDILAYIRPTISGHDNITSSIEPIPPLDLVATLYGYAFKDLNVEIDVVPPSSLSGVISGVPYLDLYSTISGNILTDLVSEYTVGYADEVDAVISGIGVDFTNITGNIHGFYAIQYPESISGYINATIRDTTILDSSISGVMKSDLNSIYTAVYHPDDLPATISSSMADWLLYSTITSTGRLDNIIANVLGTLNTNDNLTGIIDGYDSLDLLAELNSEESGYLYSNIVATGINNSYLYSTIDTNLSELVASYIPNIDNVISGSIIPIPSVDLYSSIKPKVYFIDSYIPLNLYDFDNLTVMINSDICSNKLDLSDLHVMISGQPATELVSTITSVVGQYALTVDELPLVFRKNTIIEDWMFIITQPPILLEDKLPIILTNAPLSDLSAYIEGILESNDLKAQITPRYIASVTKDNLQLGEWINFKTGERKVLKLFFKGNIKNFYYSALANTTYSEDVDDYLELFVESYDRIELEKSESLLYYKKSTRRHVIRNLADFKTIDDAIKFAIICSISELHSDLGAYIEAAGGLNDIQTTISGVDNNYIKNLYSSITVVENNPDLSASISGSGGNLNLSSYILPNVMQHTTSEIYNTYGIQYIPQLVYRDGVYSIILTKSGSNVTIDEEICPNLLVSISGYDSMGIISSISGTV